MLNSSIRILYCLPIYFVKCFEEARESFFETCIEYKEKGSLLFIVYRHVHLFYFIKLYFSHLSNGRRIQSRCRVRDL